MFLILFSLYINIQRKTQLLEYEKYHSPREGALNPWFKHILSIIFIAEYLSALTLWEKKSLTSYYPVFLSRTCVFGYGTFFADGNFPVFSPPHPLLLPTQALSDDQPQHNLNYCHINRILDMQYSWWNVNDLIAKAGGREDCASSPDQFPSLYFHKSFYVQFDFLTF